MQASALPPPAQHAEGTVHVAHTQPRDAPDSAQSVLLLFQYCLQYMRYRYQRLRRVRDQKRALFDAARRRIALLALDAQQLAGMVSEVRKRC